MKQIVEFSNKEQIEGVLARWCWDNGYASSEEHEIWASFTWKIPNEKIEEAIEFLESNFPSVSKERIKETVNNFKQIFDENKNLLYNMDINKLLIAQCVIEELKNKSKASYTNAFTVVINAINAEVVELLKKDTSKNV